MRCDARKASKQRLQSPALNSSRTGGGLPLEKRPSPSRLPEVQMVGILTPFLYIAVFVVGTLTVITVVIASFMVCDWVIKKLYSKFYEL